MESEKEKKGTFSLLRLGSTLILPGILIFLYRVVFVPLKNNTANTIGIIVILAVLAGIIALIYYVIVGAKIFIEDVVVVEVDKGWKWLNMKEDKKDKKKK